MAKVTTYPGRRAVAETVGDRMEAIRVAIGGSLREQISQEALAELVQQRTGVPFDKYKVSRLERGAQDISRTDAIALAAVDPLNRGPAWIMFGADGGASPQVDHPRAQPTRPEHGWPLPDNSQQQDQRKQPPHDKRKLGGRRRLG